MRESESKKIKCANKIFYESDSPIIMGILNVTPDSFSDGGQFLTTKKAVEAGVKMFKEGADVIDVGGVSTAPNAKPVSKEEERLRVMPVISGLMEQGINRISIDTKVAEIADEALELGAAWINDQSAALADPYMPKIMAKADALILMHSQGKSGVDAGEQNHYQDVLLQLSRFFSERIEALGNEGICKDKVVVDPGIGFGKGLDDSLKIISNMNWLREVAKWSLVGVSRKSFLGKLTGVHDPKARDFSTLGANAVALLSGADIIRTHNVLAMYELTQVFKACANHKEGSTEGENLYEAWR